MTTTPNKGLTQPANNSFVNDWDLPVNANMGIIDTSLGGNLAVSLSSTDVTLNATQALNLTYTLTGTLTAGVRLIFPNVGSQYVINNSTTGAFSVTATTVAGPGVVVPQGLRSSIYSDATTFQMYFADDRATQIGANTITLANIAKLTGPAVLGNPASSTANLAGISIADLAALVAPYLTAIPAGTVFCFATPSSIPPGYIYCDGAAVSRTTYAALFAAIGTTFGSGDGSTTFNVPNTKGYFFRGWDNGAGVDPGRVFGSIQQDAFQNHVHTFQVQVGFNVVGGSGPYPISPGNAVESTNGATTGNPGTETRPKNIALNYGIKT